MKIKVFSEREVKDYIPTEPYIHISISSSTTGLLYLPTNDFRRMIMYCHFYDLDSPYIIKSYKIFDEKEAKRIWYWVKQYLKDVDMIIVNCEAGISRSAGVAAALSKVLNGDDSYYFKNYSPNMLVYRKLLEEHCNNG